MPIVRLADILGQPAAAEFLSGVVTRGRFANAYLFYGPPGVGKGSAALAFARAILCASGPPKDATLVLLDARADTGPAGAGSAATRAGRRPKTSAAAPADDAAEAAAGPEAGDACGVCAICKKAGDLQHPDLKFLFPVSGEERELDETIGETLAQWRQDPLFVFTYEKAASIRLSLTRELIRELAFKPFESERRVVVVRDADRMRDDQCSAMLKSIEEPGASTVWVLTTSRVNRLPVTIRSRCQRVRFRPLLESVTAAFLAERAGTPDREARMLAALAGGSLGRALAFREAAPLETRNQALALVEPALRGDPAGLWKAVQSFNRFGRAGRETLRRLIEFQQLWLRDLLRARYGAPREDLVNRDREPEIRRQAESIDATEIRRRLMVLEDALRAIEGNVTPDLALFSAMSRIADPTLGAGDWPAHLTARWNY